MRGEEGGWAHSSLWQRIKLALSELTLAMVAILQAVPHRHPPQPAGRARERQAEGENSKGKRRRRDGGRKSVQTYRQPSGPPLPL